MTGLGRKRGGQTCVTTRQKGMSIRLKIVHKRFLKKKKTSCDAKESLTVDQTAVFIKDRL